MAVRLLANLTLRTVLAYLAVAGVVFALLLYVGFQARFIIAGPAVVIHTPDGIYSDRAITLEGQATNIVGITLNGRTIYTDERGYFKETLVLENGYTIATVRAKDRYGRTTAQARSFVYKPLADNS